MIVIRVAVEVKPEKADAFVDHLQQEMADVKQFAGCERFHLYTDVQDANKFLLYEEWETAENFQAYRTSEFFAENSKKLHGMMVGEPDSAYFEASLVA